MVRDGMGWDGVGWCRGGCQGGMGWDGVGWDGVGMVVLPAPVHTIKNNGMGDFGPFSN